MSDNIINLQTRQTDHRFKNWAENGFLEHIIPIIPFRSSISATSKIKEGGKTPGLPSQFGWVGLPKWTSYVLDVEKIKELDEVAVAYNTKNANLGLKTKELPFIDIDVDENKFLVDQIIKIAEKVLGKAPKRYREGSSRCGLLYKFAKFHSVSKSYITFQEKLNNKVEILGDGQQFVAVGDHKSGHDYKWSEEPVFDELTEVTEKQIEEFYDAVFKFAIENGYEQRVKKVKVEKSKDNKNLDEIYVPQGKKNIAVSPDTNPDMWFDTSVGKATIEDILDDIEYCNEHGLTSQYEGCVMKHPEDHDYANGQVDIAQLFINFDSVVIHSHAHSGINYYLSREKEKNYKEYLDSFRKKKINQLPVIDYSFVDIFLILKKIRPDKASIKWVGEALFNERIEPCYLLFEAWIYEHRISMTQDEIIALWHNFSTYRHDTNIFRIFNHKKSTDFDDSIADLVNYERNYKLMLFSSIYALVDKDDDIYLVRNKYSADKEQFIYSFETFDSRAKFYKQDKVPIYNEKKKEIEHKSILPIWLDWRNSAKIRYGDCFFRPDSRLNVGFSLTHEPVLNLYRGLMIIPMEGEWEFNQETGMEHNKHVDFFLNHILDVVCDGQTIGADYLVKWFARMFQKPWKKGETAIALYSKEQRTGKSIILDNFCKVFGEYGHIYSGVSHGRFNGEMQTNIAVVYNEATYGGNHEIAGKLKAEITDDERMIEGKFKTPVMTRNHSHVMIASNNEWYAPIEEDDCRFVNFDVSAKRQNDRDYFNKLGDIMSIDGHLDEIIHFLIHKVDISKFDPRDLPVIRSASRIENKLASRNESHVRWLRDCLNSGEFLSGGFNNSIFTSNDEQLMIPEDVVHYYINDLLNRFKAWKEYYNDKTELISSKAMGKMLDDYCGAAGKGKRKRIGGGHVGCYRMLPGLKACRLNFEKKIGGEIDWDEEEDDE